MERKVIADVQLRLGPMVAGPRGMLQPVADAVKLLFKEDIIPKYVDRPLYLLAPVLVFVPTYLLLTLIPLDENIFVTNLDVAILVFLAISSILPIGHLIAGYSSGNKYAFISSLRSAAQMMSYEIPIVLVILGVVVLSGSMSIVDIVLKQQETTWFLFVLPLGFFIFFVSTLMEMGRVPFDTIEAESELIAGVHIEYSGMRFAFFFLAEYLHLFIGCSLITLLFLGGWAGPILPGALWFFIKTFILIWIFIWIRATVPRFRIDQVLNLGWKYLIPLALVNIGLIGVTASI
jgi:NADH-quinone oxidoreductase subunit H